MQVGEKHKCEGPGASVNETPPFGERPGPVNDSYNFDIWSLVCDRANEGPNE